MTQPDLSLKLPKAWSEFLGNPEVEAWWSRLEERYLAETKTQKICPTSASVFRALELTPPSGVRVVILGQDPYHGPGQAHGLAFSVPQGVSPPPSLANIQKELRSSFPNESHRLPPTDLSQWAKQGVLLLNTVLSVREGAAFSHKAIGWELLTERILERLGHKDLGIVFLLWGNPARSKKHRVSHPSHLILEAPHPSPLSAYRGFLGCEHFKKTNDHISAMGGVAIDWFAGIGLV
jgi:uracil-DNA glycosylase